jgi:hypothetical protein
MTQILDLILTPIVVFGEIIRATKEFAARRAAVLCG